MKKFILLFLTVIASLNIYSQITTKEQPISLSLRSGGHGLEEKLTTSRPISLSVPDMKTVYEEDAVNDRKMDKPYRVGIRIPVSYNSKKDGQWITMDDGSRLWQLTVTAESARSLDLTFSKFWLPDSTKFFVYNPHTLETIGAITSEYLQGDKDNPDKFSTAVVRGDTLTLEYYQPKGIKELPVIELSGVYYGYRTKSAIRQRGLFGSASECEVNVNCSEGNNWTNEKRSVTCILLKNSVESVLATGSLVMNTGLDFKPYVLTANHAVKYLNFDAVTNPDMSLSIFLWNYESPDCAGTQLSYLSTVGATLIANPALAPSDSVAAGDFALLLLKQDPRFLNEFTPYYLGWDRSASYGAGGVCIHHPNGDMKKISTYSCVPTIMEYNSYIPNNSGGYLRVNWIETENGHGITESGSSGSPLINNNHKLIGQLVGAPGLLSCANPTWPSVYGRFYTSWTGNGSPSPRRRLKDWLDPLGTNQTTISGRSCNTIHIVGQSFPCGPEVYYISDLPSDYTVEWYFQSSPYLNPSIMSQNTPLPNQCTINFAVGQEINEILKARIKYNGFVVKVISKALSNVHHVGGAYSQEAGSTTPAIGVTAFSGTQPISVYPNALVTIISGALQNKNVTYSGSPLSYWHYNSSTGVVKLKFPQTTNSQSVRICAKNLSSCEKSIIDVNTIQSASSLSSGLIVSVAQNQINFQIEETDKTHFNASYPIEVINYETGRSVYSGIFYNGLSISTIGWKPGIYIAVCNIGEKKVTQKITLK